MKYEMKDIVSTLEPLMKFTNLIPMLNVSNIETSLDFYERALGFQIVSSIKAIKEQRWTTIRSEDTELMLSESQCDLGLNWARWVP